MMLKFLLAIVMLSAGVVVAQTASPPAAGRASEAKKAPAGQSVEEQIRAKVEARVGTRPESVTRMPFGLYEVVLGTEVIYTDANVNYFIAGRVIDAKTREDLTEKRRAELLKVDFKTLPLDQAVKLVRGNGSRVFATFEDPNCPYCKKLHKDMRDLKDVTIYTFLYPILSQDSFDKSKNIWCAKDRAAAWDEFMVDGKAPPAAATDCKHPLQQVLALGQKLDVSGTPTILFPDGTRLPGAVPVEKIEEILNASAAKR
jgi:thiol:disulfide interchange protein DsbC